MRTWAALIGVMMFSVPAVARADESPHVRRLAYDARVDGAVVGTGVLWVVAAELLKAELVPEKCRWCYRQSNGESALNFIDRDIRLKLKWTNEDLAGTISSVLAFGVMPAAAIGLPTIAAGYDSALLGAPVDALLVAEATILAANLNELVKFVFVRERPYVHYLPHAPDGIKGLTGSPSDANLSFYSGHTNLAFALAASSSTVALMRGYRLAPMVLGVQLASAISVGYLRIAADKHYFSDVMVGAVLGSLVGAFVPILLHPATDSTSSSAAVGTVPQALSPARPPIVFDGRW